jgi:3-phosphoshikimate 1-carboxyvinyltransferase
MKSKKFSLVINKPIDNFDKKIVVDSDKSISIRSFLIGSISEGVSSVQNVLESEDVFSTINCLRKLKIKILYIGDKTYKIFGRGLGSYMPKNSLKLNFGNSGTLARLMIGILASTPNININIFGDKSLNKRSMKKLIFLMNKFGAEFFPKNKYFFPLRISSSNFPIGISYKSGTSAQLKSAVILAGLNYY